MNKFEKLLQELRGNDKKIARYLNVTNEKACRMFALGTALFVSTVLAITIFGITGSVMAASFAATGSLTMLAPLSIIICNRFLRAKADTGVSPAIINRKESLKLDFQEDLRMIDEMKVTQKEIHELKLAAYKDYKVKLDKLETLRLR